MEKCQKTYQQRLKNGKMVVESAKAFKEEMLQLMEKWCNTVAQQLTKCYLLSVT